MAPGTLPWLTLDFVEGILRRSEADNSIQVIDIFVKPATSKGDNYTSDMYRVVAEFSRNQGDRKINEKKSVIVKISPMDEGSRKDLIEASMIFNTEIFMMSEVLLKMNELLKPDNRLSADIYCSQMKEPTFLMMEDLAVSGFRMADRQAGLDMAHSLLAIHGLAKFHASSVALCEKEPKYKDSFKRGMFSSEHPEELRAFFVLGTKTLANEVANWPGLGKKYADKIMALSDNIYLKGIEVVQRKDDEFNVINHGDSWVNNMLFKYNEEGKPCGHIFVDFQMCTYTSPAMDLHYFLCTSPEDKEDESCMKRLLEEYLHVLTNTMKRLGCKTSPPSMKELERYMKERAMYGMISAFTVLPITMGEKEEAKSLDEILQKDGSYVNPSYKGRRYRELMTKKIPIYDKMGLLEP